MPFLPRQQVLDSRPRIIPPTSTAASSPRCPILSRSSPPPSLSQLTTRRNIRARRTGVAVAASAQAAPRPDSSPHQPDNVLSLEADRARWKRWRMLRERNGSIDDFYRYVTGDCDTGHRLTDGSPYPPARSPPGTGGPRRLPPIAHDRWRRQAVVRGSGETRAPQRRLPPARTTTVGVSWAMIRAEGGPSRRPIPDAVRLDWHGRVAMLSPIRVTWQEWARSVAGMTEGIRPDGTTAGTCAAQCTGR